MRCGTEGLNPSDLLVKLPATRLRTLTRISNSVSTAISSPRPGNVMREEIMLVVEGMSPMAIPLQEPLLTWRPLVKVLPVQKLMKLAGSVRDSA